MSQFVNCHDLLSFHLVYSYLSVEFFVFYGIFETGKLIFSYFLSFDVFSPVLEFTLQLSQIELQIIELLRILDLELIHLGRIFILLIPDALFEILNYFLVLGLFKH